jgi:uncharacterized protein involved in response to NO
MARGWSPLAHAHEMLFGFALAVVAGNQLGALPRPRLFAMLALWAAARAAFLLFPESRTSTGLNAAFAVVLALHIVPRLLGAAKKLRNRALPAILAALCAAAAFWGAPLLLPAVVLFALLMLFMGGRIIAPAVAGQLHRQGERLDARVQPRIEGALLVAGVIALTQVFPLAPAALAAAGALAAVRLARWRLWRVRGRPDLLCLAAGYAWLALGLLALGAALGAGRHLSAAFHLVTVGALGTLTFNVMAISWLLKARRPLDGAPEIVAGTLLLAAATVCRVMDWLAIAATCWSAAFVLLCLLFLRNAPATRRA